MRGVKLIAFLLLSITLVAQQDSVSKRDWFSLNGYIKNMQTMSFGVDLDNITTDNLIHNRLNLRLTPTNSTEIGIEVRNRLFTGETVETLAGYSQLLDSDSGLVDLSFLIIDEPALILLSQVDRAWIAWGNEAWDIRLGRQRINWGMNLFWNSNDLFNAYSLVDFDYEERPGSDALRVQRFFNNMRSLELAVKPGRTSKDWIGAIMYRFNKWRYDFQVMAGWWNTDVAVGTGWAGNVGNAGFKGEVTYFHPQERPGDTTGVLSASVSGDYIFRNQLFLTLGLLLNTTGVDTSFSVAENLFVAPLSAKNLMPTKYSSILSLSFPFNPLLAAGLTIVYAPVVHTAFFMPMLSYSIAANWGIALFGQSFWLDTGKFSNIGNGVFLRLKGSF